MQKLTVRQLAVEFGVTHPTMSSRLKDAGHKVKRGGTWTIKEAHEAMARLTGVRERTEAAKLKNLEEDGMRKEFERRQLQKELITPSEAKEIFARPLEPIARDLKDMPARLSMRVNPADPILARQELDEYVRNLCEKVRNACEVLEKN
jgi:transcriptional regulator NrdR family protein